VPYPTGAQLRAARDGLGLSRAKLAAQLTHLNENQVLHVEGGRPLRPAEAEELLRVLAELGADLPAVDAPAPPTVAHVERVQVDRVAPSWSGSTQTSVPLGPVRTDVVRSVSNSEVATWLDCKRKWWLEWYRGLTKLRESPVGARAIGDRVHRALQEWYVPDGQVGAHPAEVLERLIVEDWTTLTQADLTSLDMEKQFNSEANLERAMVEGYFEWLAETGADADLQVVAPETYIEAPLAEAGVLGDQAVRLIGKVDVRVRRVSDGARLFIDHKTMAEFARARLRITLGDPQMLHYHLLEWLSTAEGEERCDGALYNMLRRVKRTGTAKPPFYERVPVRHNVHQIQNYRARLEGNVVDILQTEAMLAAGADHHGVVGAHPTNDCGWKCDFVAVCPMFDDGSRAEAMLAQLYVVRDPMSYYKGINVQEESK
jgi:hypothetical protein